MHLSQIQKHQHLAHVSVTLLFLLRSECGVWAVRVDVRELGHEICQKARAHSSILISCITEHFFISCVFNSQKEMRS